MRDGEARAEGRGADGWKVAPTLVEAGVGCEALGELLGGVGPEAFGAVTARVAAQLRVASLVRKHRGNIRVESKPGDTCFQVRLPVAAGGGTR